ncbi:MAG: hypothetical protein FWG30_03470 [Eubacteriaceae bacterium]|nr:hypothetical protein [Eubacteriaceae bacterium]
MKNTKIQSADRRFDTKPVMAVGKHIEDKHPIDLLKLRPYVKAPRGDASDLVLEMAAAEPFFKRKQTQKKLSEAEMAFAYVSSCDERLTAPGSNRFCRAVIIYSLEESYRLNISWLSQAAAAVSLQASAPQTKDCRAFAKLYNDSTSYFRLRLPQECSFGATAWAASLLIAQQELLPHSCMPPERLLPFIITENSKRKPNFKYYLLPRKYYEVAP